MTDYSRLPEHIRSAAQRYIEHGVNPGSFLTAVFANDLIQAVGRADEHNRRALFDICCFVYSEAPAMCHGSYTAVDTWVQHHAERVDQTLPELADELALYRARKQS